MGRIITPENELKISRRLIAGEAEKTIMFLNECSQKQLDEIRIKYKIPKKKSGYSWRKSYFQRTT